MSVPRRMTIGYFRQDVEEMAGRSVLDEAILGSGRVGDLHHELEATQSCDGRPGAGRRDGPDPRALRRGAGGVRTSRRLRARSAGARSAARPRLRRREDRRRCRTAVGRVEDACGDGAGAARASRRAVDGRADEPPRHRIDHLARRVSEGFARRAAHDLARSRVHEPPGDQDRGDRQRRDHGVFRQLRFLRARARGARGEPRSGVRAAAGHAGQGTAVHRALCRACRQGGPGTEPGQGAGENREDRAAEEAPGREVRLPRAATIGRTGRDAGRRHQSLRTASRARRAEPDDPPRRALVRDGQERRGQVDAAEDGGRRAAA